MGKHPKKAQLISQRACPTSIVTNVLHSLTMQAFPRLKCASRFYGPTAQALALMPLKNVCLPRGRDVYHSLIQGIKIWFPGRWKAQKRPFGYKNVL